MSKKIPAEIGIDPKKLKQMLMTGSARGLDSIAIARHGKTILQAYINPCTQDMPHVMYSATKSVITTLAGLLIDEGKISFDDTVMSYFPEVAPENMSEYKESMTFRHLLTMTTGHDVDSVKNLMMAIENWPKTFLDQAVPEKPGSRFVYDSGASYMIAAIIARVVGKSVREFAIERLFTAMDITNYFWQTCPQGVHNGGWGLYLTTRDMIKFGQLFLDKGIWKGKRLVPLWWTLAATKKHITTNPDDPDNLGYGYQWWMTPWGYSAAGMGGQLIYVVPEHDMVVAMTTSGSGDCNDMPGALMERYIIPAVLSSALKEDDMAKEKLQKTITKLAKKPKRIPALLSANIKEFEGKEFSFSDDSNIKSLSFNFEPNSGDLMLMWKNEFDDIVTSKISFGFDNRYRLSDFETKDMINMEYTTLYARGVFSGDRLLEVEVRVPGELYIATWQFNFEDSKVKVRTLRNSITAFPEFDTTSL